MRPLTWFGQIGSPLSSPAPFRVGSPEKLSNVQSRAKSQCSAKAKQASVSAIVAAKMR